MTFEPFRSVVLPKRRGPGFDPNAPAAPAPAQVTREIVLEGPALDPEALADSAPIPSREGTVSGTVASPASQLAPSTPTETALPARPVPTGTKTIVDPVDPDDIPLILADSGEVSAPETFGGVPIAAAPPPTGPPVADSEAEEVLEPVATIPVPTRPISAKPISANPDSANTVPANTVSANTVPANPVPAKPEPANPAPQKSGSSRSTGHAPRQFVVAYDGKLLGTYRSQKRIQHRTAYLKVAEQLNGQIEDFDPNLIRLYKLTEIPLPEPIEKTDIAESFHVFPRDDVPAPDA